MKLFSWQRFLMVIFFFGSAPVFSGVIIEPTAGYEIGKHQLINVAGVDYGAATTGLTIGGRAGYRFAEYFWVAADFQRASGLNSRATNHSTGMTGSLDRTNAYFDFGVDFPFWLRVWAGYGILARAKVKADPLGTVLRSKGTSWKVGIGVQPWLFLSINAEYFSNNFSKIDHPTLGVGDINSRYPTSNDRGFVIGVSAPLTL